MCYKKLNQYIYVKYINTVQFSHSVVPNPLQPHRLQHTRLPCPSPSPGAYLNSCPSSWWCHPTILSSVIPFSSHLQYFQTSVFSSKSFLHIRWPKYWSFSFSISPANEYSGLISFKIDRLDLLAVQGTLKNLLQYKSSRSSKHQFFRIQSYSHIHTLLPEKPKLWLDGPLSAK